MSRVKSMREARDGPAVIFKTYLTEKSKGIKYHFFVENHDDVTLYINFLSEMQIDIRKTMFYKCKNKDGVLCLLYKLRSNKSDMRNTFFIVDSDYDRLLGNSYPQEVYATDYYSIESLIPNESMMRKIWLGQLFNIPDAVKYESFVLGWIKLLNSFTKNFAVDFYARLIYLTRQSKKYNLEKINMGSYLTYGSKAIVRFERYKFNDAFKRILNGDEAEVDYAAIKSIKLELIEMPIQSYAVGKHILYLFTAYVIKFVEYIRSMGTSPTFRSKIQYNLRNAIENFTDLVDPPESLRLYISSRMFNIQAV